MGIEDFGSKVLAVSLARTKEPILKVEVSLDELRQALQPCTCEFCRNPDMTPQEVLVRYWGANMQADQSPLCSKPYADSHMSKTQQSTDVP